ncbi:hypothetical protein GCM10009720_28090 [Yaniella flava]|uniref:HTH hxlR-type domain-containing protein n=1 Tax=Yaniella flava TaxID=287930 RepID=A0ABN2UXR7_9MICC
MIVPALAGGALRFSALKEAVAGVSSKVLTETLRSLQRDGLVHREVFVDHTPIRVEYELTELGRTLILPLAALRTWAETYAPDVLKARDVYDAGSE